MLLASFMTEVEPYSHSIHCPMPQELARKTTPSIPLWIREGMKPIEYKTLYDLTSSYQADYCGIQTQVSKNNDTAKIFRFLLYISYFNF